MVVGGWHIYIRNKYTYQVPSLVWPIFYQILMHYSRKKKVCGGGGMRMEFLGVLKKGHVEVPGVNKKRSEISRGVENWCRIFMDPGFWPWNFQEVSRTILQNFQGWKFVFNGNSIGKVKNLKFAGGFQKGISSTPNLAFSWNSPIKQASS